MKLSPGYHTAALPLFTASRLPNDRKHIGKTRNKNHAHAAHAHF